MDPCIWSTIHSLGNTLNLICSNCPSLISNLSISPTCDNNSDHYLISFQLSHHRFLRAAPASPHLIWSYSKAYFFGLQSNINVLLISDLNCSQLNVINSIWAHIKDCITTVCKLFVTIARIPKCPSPKCMVYCWNPSFTNKSHTFQCRLNKNLTVHLLSRLKQSLQESLFLYSGVCLYTTLFHCIPPVLVICLII